MCGVFLFKRLVLGLARDETEKIASHQQQEQCERESDADRQCSRHATITMAFSDHVVKRRAQAGENREQEENDDDTHDF